MTEMINHGCGQGFDNPTRPTEGLGAELRAAFDAGVEAAERGAADLPEELDIHFAIHMKLRAKLAERRRSGS